MRAVVRAGLIIGTLDILAAFLQFYLTTYNNPVVVLHYIAGGVFGITWPEELTSQAINRRHPYTWIATPLRRPMQVSS